MSCIEFEYFVNVSHYTSTPETGDSNETVHGIYVMDRDRMDVTLN